MNSKLHNSFLSPKIFDATFILNRNIRYAMEYVAKKYAHGKLADLGCGIQPYKPIFNNFITEYVGIDSEVTKNSNYNSATIADMYVDICDTGLDDESFDTILSTQVLEHIYDTDQYVAECYRLLKKDGYAIFTVPQTYECHAKPYDYYRFTLFSLMRKFEEQSFNVIELRSLENAYATLQQIKIVSIVFGKYKDRHNDMSILNKIDYKLRQYLVVPYLNIKAVLFDKYCNNSDLCLNYLLIVKK